MSAPWSNKLPIALNVAGGERPIRSDYRAALDAFLALNDLELDDYNRAMEVLDIIYVDELDPEHYQEAIDKAMWFLRGGEPERNSNQPKVVDWEKDFNLIAAPISKIIGEDIRGMDYLHWWTFLSAYMGIGDCLFSQIVAIRDKKARGKSLDKSDKEFYRRNRDLIDIKPKYTQKEIEFLKEWT